MADPGSANLPARTADPGSRGSLSIKDKVYERLAELAAISTDGVVRHASGLDRVTGRELPRVQAHADRGRVRAEIDIAVAWPHSVAAVSAAVRASVTDQLGRGIGMHVVRVDVRVPTILPPGATAPETPRRRVQ